MESSYIMTKGRALEAFPVLKSDGLVGALVYYDGEELKTFHQASPISPLLLFPNPGQHNDSRMNVSLIMTAAQHGATVVNHTEVISLFKQSSGQLCGARVQDCLTGEVIDVRAQVKGTRAGSNIVAIGMYLRGYSKSSGHYQRYRPILRQSAQDGCPDACVCLAHVLDVYVQCPSTSRLQADRCSLLRSAHHLT
jgi:glycerol-3-phosphate dehydrogenase